MKTKQLAVTTATEEFTKALQALHTANKHFCAGVRARLFSNDEDEAAKYTNEHYAPIEAQLMAVVERELIGNINDNALTAAANGTALAI